jgi:hypothetical protein
VVVIGGYGMKQTDRILNHLREHGSITQLEAMSEYGCFRLASRISDLRSEGINIKREIVKGKNRYNEPTHFAKYRLEELNNGQ